MTMGAMDHGEVRELLEDAAIEPGGLERLMAGDTPAAALVAGHLTGCPECADELERLRRSVGLIRPAVRDVPPPELRERTLAYVAALGRPRGTSALDVAPAEPAGVVAVPHEQTTAPDSPMPAAPLAPVPSRRASRIAPLLGLAAALVLAVAGPAVVTTTTRDGELRLQAAEIEALGDVARSTLQLDRQPDVRRVALASNGGSAGGPTGQLTFSPATTQLVVVADGLTPPPAGREYRCWVERGGTRMPIGKMFFGGDVAYWVGPVAAVGGIGPDASFGVSLIDVANPSAPGDAVLTGAG
jgi:hypothetical protein